MSDVVETLDWRGEPVDCGGCAHRALMRRDACALGRACVHDRYARRIDRFFAQNPIFADDYLAHPHFEVRAIADKYATVFKLPPLLGDEDETVRWNATRRLPRRYALALRDDPHREVRMRVATLLEGDELQPMASDADYYVRLVVARRLAPTRLAGLLRDPEPEVRRVVARRAPECWLGGMTGDPDPSVRREVAQRLPAARLALMRDDSDWRVRYEAASRAPSDALGALVDDPDALVRERARERAGSRTEARP